jgi:GrpB-like predicted nucleotidyltransferase (UPF0157 family)
MTLRAQRADVVPYDESWPARFSELAGAVRGALGDAALRIDHIGATAVPGTAARPVIDIQVSVAAFEPSDAYVPQLEDLGYSLLPDDDRTQRFFGRRVDNVARVHVRVAGSFAEQRALLVRDHLRDHPDEPGLAEADRWAQETGWSPGPSDA